MPEFPITSEDSPEAFLYKIEQFLAQEFSVLFGRFVRALFDGLLQLLDTPRRRLEHHVGATLLEVAQTVCGLVPDVFNVLAKVRLASLHVH
jgi:hypothetical protein